MKILKALLLLILIGLLFSGAYLKTTLSGWMINKSSPAEIAKLIEPHITVYKPEGEGPFPTILQFHGCGGIKEQQIFWAEHFKSKGFAVAYVDSYVGRDINRDRALSHVCKGRQLIGGERAGDVLTAIAWAKQQPWADFDNLTLAGWSHGAWSIMDAFTLSTENKLPHNLNAAPDADLSDVDNLVLFYPYCGIADQSSGSPWEYTPSTIAITAQHDTVVGDNVCDESFSLIKLNAPRFLHKVFVGVNHAFDSTVVVKNINWELATPIEEALAATNESKAIINQFLTAQK